MKRHHKATVGLFIVLIAVCTFLTTPVFAQAQQAQADQSEIASLLNSSHETSWAYYTDPTGTWFISSSSGVTYALGRNNQNHASWIAIAAEEAVAAVYFSDKKVTLRTDTAARTPNDSYRAISLVSGEAAETVYNGKARERANLINGNTLDLKWYFFKVESTRLWYIVWINGTDSTIHRLKLNDTIDRPTEGCPVKGCYDWQRPLDGSGAAVDTSNWTKSFYQENGAWKVRFNTSSLSSFQWPIPIPAGATIDSQATAGMNLFNSSGARYLYKAGFEFLQPTGTTYPPCGGRPRVDFHPGIDINVVGTSGMSDIGTPVYAIADGTVTGTESGGSIVIEHPVGDGTSVWANYRHTREIGHRTGPASFSVATGQRVTKGQQIAEMGEEGAPGASHLHFEVRKSGHPDPTSARFWCGYGGRSDTTLDNWLYNPLQFIRDHR